MEIYDSPERNENQTQPSGLGSFDVLEEMKQAQMSRANFEAQSTSAYGAVTQYRAGKTDPYSAAFSSPERAAAPANPVPESLRDPHAPSWTEIFENKEREAFQPGNRGGSLFPEKFELKRLNYRTADHSSPDAVVYVPRGFDPTKPINLVIYNHGLTSNVSQAVKNSELERQMDMAPPNTVLIVPEWAANPQAYSQQAGPFHQPGFFRGMLTEIMSKTPAFEGRNINDVAGISIVTHSGGYNAAMSEIYKNGLEDKVMSVTLLDSLYNGKGFDKWIQDNIYDLASGRKRFQNFFAGTADASKAQADRVEQMLRKAGLSPYAMVRDYNNGRYVMDSSTIANHGLVFKYSSVDVRGRGAHSSVTNVYVGQVMAA